MGKALNAVAARISKEVGISRRVSYRIAKKLNELAEVVSWASPVEPSEAVKTVKVSSGRAIKKRLSRRSVKQK